MTLKLNIKQLIVGELATNCYIIHHDQQALIIDPGDDFAIINSFLVQEKLTPLAILLTHGHFDHILAAKQLQNAFKIKIYCHFLDKKLADNVSNHYQFFMHQNRNCLSPALNVDLNKQTELKIADFSCQVIHTPGHTAGSVCFYFANKASLFTGDTLFANGYLGRTDFEESLPVEMAKSVKKLLTLPNNVLVYPGHGEISDIKTEKVYHKHIG